MPPPTIASLLTSLREGIAQRRYSNPQVPGTTSIIVDHNAPVVRPHAPRAWYHYNPTRWAAVGSSRKRTLCHIHRIESDNYGEIAFEPCQHCQVSHHSCRVYQERVTGRNITKSCGRCRFAGRGCSHDVRAPFIRLRSGLTDA